MKLTCQQSDLNTHLSLVSRVVPGRSRYPILANVLIKIDEEAGQVALIGFNEAMAIQTTFPAEIIIGGELTLPAKLLEGIVSRLPNEAIAIESLSEDCGVTLTSASGTYEVRGLSAEDYPSLPDIADGDRVELSAAALQTGLKSTLIAVGTDETKQLLQGMRLTSDDNILEFAATDGHRLMVIQTQDESVPDCLPGLELTVPAKALRDLDRMMQGCGDDQAITLKFDRTQAIFELGQQRLITRLLEGQYPNYRQFIPKQFERQVTVDRKQFIEALERIAVLADQNNNIVKLTLADQAIAVSVEAQEVGSGREVVKAQITGDDLNIAFNVRYLLDGLKVLGTSEVQLQCNSPTSPAVIVPLGELQMTYLLMPIKMRNL